MKLKYRHHVITIILLIILLFSAIEDVSFAQAFKIRGVILDLETRTAIPFVNISIQNSAQGTVSDKNGRFEIQLSGEKSRTIVFSHVAYYKKEIEVDATLSSQTLNIFLSPKVLKFQNVVVSAALYEQPLNKLSKPATIISRRQISDNMQSNLTDMLAFTPGFTQVWEYQSPLLLRGMNSKRLIVMKNGNRRIGNFPGGYFGQDINIYDVQKVEIIKGPGSVIYGSGAISGIINIINKPPFGTRETSVKILSGFGSNNMEYLQVARLCHQRKSFGFSVNGKYRNTDDMVYGNGETADNSNVEDRDLSLNMGYKLSDKQHVALTVEYHYGDWGKPRGFNGPDKAFTEIRNEEDRLHTAFNYSYSPGIFIETVKFNMYYDKGTRDYYKYKYSTVSDQLTSLELVHYKDNYGGGQFFTTLNLSSDNKLSVGIDGYAFQLDNPAEVVDYYDNTRGKLPGYMNAGQSNIGAFINDEWEITKTFRLLTGIRFDAATVNEGQFTGKEERTENRTAVSGNLGVVYSPQPDMHFSMNVGRAFRMPTAEELFTEIISCKGTKLGNSDLSPEYGNNIDLGFRGMANQKKLRYDLSLFYNRLDDYINETSAVDIPDVDFTYKNTDARIWGGEFSMAYCFENFLKPLNDLYAGIGGAYVYGVDLALPGDDAPLFGIPPLKITADMKYHGLMNRNWLTGYDIKIQAEYAAEQNRVAKIPEGCDSGTWGYIPSDDHLVFNFIIALNSNSLPGFPKLRIVVKNIFNQDYQPFGSYLPAMGRNFKTVLSFDI